MRNDRLLLAVCLVFLAGGAFLLIRGLRHPRAAAPPAPFPLPAVGPVTPAPPVPTSAAVAETTPDTEPAAPPAASVLPDAAPSPAATPLLIPGISVDAFLENPDRLDRHPMDVGRCRIVEHWNTGYCYVYSLGAKRKISVREDVLCENLPRLRARMRVAIESGECRQP